ncbi:PaaI family thioesterase [Oceanobacillus saliphilus]|uniref:PaaI family thioesterase n=1 Tax=Oceanobacillus saliphilus TaxID=2925834 RepID=UPI00201E0CA1|nr:PaaI family thioesterase [Oceanobacillus saliphilus]
MSTLAEDEIFTTVEIKINFLKPIWEGKLRAEGNIIKKGRTTGLVECHIYDTKRKHCSTFNKYMYDSKR